MKTTLMALSAMAISTFAVNAQADSEDITNWRAMEKPMAVQAMPAKIAGGYVAASSEIANWRMSYNVPSQDLTATGTYGSMVYDI